MVRRPTVLALIVCIILPALAAAQESDTTAPSLGAVDIDPDQVDTSLAPQTVFVTMQVADDLSGTSSVRVAFTSPSRAKEAIAFASRSTDLDGWWTAAVTIPQFSESGLWNLEILTRDFAGNFGRYATAELVARGFPYQVNVTSTPDVTAPHIESLAFSPASVDVSAGPANVTLTIDLTDDLSGVPSCEEGGSVAVTIFAPTAGQAQLQFCPTWTRISGSDLAGTWVGSFTIPQFSEAGTWGIQVVVRDAAQNVAILHTAEALARGMTLLDVVSSPSDTAPPNTLALTLTPSIINTSASNQTVTLHLGVTDDLSGAALNTPGAITGAAIFSSPSGAQTVVATGFQLIEGTPHDGVWQARASFPRFAESGTWRISRLHANDAANNLKVLLTADLEAAGLPSELIVIRPSLDADGTLSSAGGTVTDTVFGSRAQLIAPAGVLSETTTVAIDVLSSPLAIPTPTGYTGAGTFFVNVQMSPAPAFPLAPPGLTVRLPLRDSMPAGSRIDLYRVNPDTGQLEPSLDTSGQPVRGFIDGDGLSVWFYGVARFSTVVGLIPDRIDVPIDIHPVPGWSGLIPIRPSSHWPIPVAIVSTPTFDAMTQVDRSSLTFGRTGSEPSLSVCSPIGLDVNRDRRPDLVCLFTTRLTGFTRGDLVGILRGRTVGGTAIEGRDAVMIID
jgi:hypothetical protein